MNNIIKKVSIILAAAAALMSVTGCSVSLSSTKEESKIVMTADSYDVPYEVYRYFALNYKDTTSLSDSEIEDKATESVKSLYALFAIAEDRGVEPDGDYINALVSDSVGSVIDECGGRKEYKAALEEKHMNDSVFRLLTKSEIVRDELYRNMIESGELSADEDSIRAVIESEEFICVKQILILGESSASSNADTVFTPAEKHTDEEAAALAEEARARAADGEDFDALVAEYGESLYMFSNTDGYYLCRGMWDEVNESAAFALEVGEVSPVILSSAGYSVFKRCEKSSEYIEKNYTEIANNYYGAYLTLAVEEKAATVKIEKTADFSDVK